MKVYQTLLPFYIGEGDLMAIDPATARLLAQAALKAATDEEARKKIIIIALVPLRD